MDRATLKRNAKAAIKGNVGTMFVITLLIAVINSLVTATGVGSIVTGLVLGPAFSLATYAIYLNMVNGQKAQVSDLFSHLGNFWPAFKVGFLQGLFVFLWCLLFIIPGLIKSISYSQAMFILAENPNMRALDAISESKKLMNGHKMEYFILQLSFLGWIILGAFTFGLLYIWLIPYMNATMANFYNNVKNPYGSRYSSV